MHHGSTPAATHGGRSTVRPDDPSTEPAPVTVLQPGSGPVRSSRYLPAEPDQVLWGRLPNDDDRPVVTLSPGDDLTIDTVSHEGLLPDQGSDPVAFFGRHGVPPEHVLADAVAIARSGRRDPERDGPHVVTGPIAVEGAEPGDVLTMTVLETLPRVPYGVVSNRHGRGALHGEYPVDGTTVSVFADVVPGDDGPRGRIPITEGGHRYARFPLAPFLGIMGVATPGERLHSVPPGRHGGNIDVNLLQVGAQLHLPVLVSGALAYVGDPHFAQGDGEVALTAMEASLRATVRFDVTPAAEAAQQFGELVWPLVETHDHLVPTGLDPDLDEAVRACVRHAIAILGARYGMEPHLAYAYLSAATDFDVSQVVDLVTGAHARIRKADFADVR
ncbi:acetamidase/formamidase family protein [Curtobacterium sp. MCSS17_007]|uniref:acetamidase/formamidase family protein n=1 Tax=Curtobacterium sp. MCSS17_007 TaxID=2175646 RepID=UPI000DA9D252|nr:acetamidase/formamidase family protein [Curtobacterium sp. MCSS17_007]WIE74235.1 acetamidase/formamidase family protein [Curtobacterium sp. MCSS17_007]